MKRFHKADVVYFDFLNALFAGIPDNNKCLYSNIFFVGRRDDLEDEDDMLVSPETFIDANGVTLTNFMETVVPIISIKVENVADININKFDDMTKELKKIAEETRLKDEAWKEERRKLELQRMEEAIGSKQKIIAVFSKTLSPAECRWSSTEREELGLFLSIENECHY